MESVGLDDSKEEGRDGEFCVWERDRERKQASKREGECGAQTDGFPVDTSHTPSKEQWGALAARGSRTPYALWKKRESMQARGTL